jgi:hypothetical protein
LDDDPRRLPGAAGDWFGDAMKVFIGDTTLMFIFMLGNFELTVGGYDWQVAALGIPLLAVVCFALSLRLAV